MLDGKFVEGQIKRLASNHMFDGGGKPFFVFGIKQ
jgi:hypothetical protein